jgi:ubiquinone/menaquinone biosynthesis C-methylase UbiE
MFDVSDSAYDNFMGRYSMRLAPVFADFAGVEGGRRVLDVGAGTGALTADLVRRGADVAAADPSPPFVAALHERFPALDVQQAPAEELPWPDASFDAALAQLVVTFMRDAPAGIAEMQRVVRPGGVVAICMWDREGMELLGAIHRTQQAVGATGQSTEARNLYRRREELESLLPDRTDTQLLEVEAGYTGFEELWASMQAGVGPAGTWVASLDDAQRAAARDELFRQVGSPGGEFTLAGRAWAVRATRG